MENNKKYFDIKIESLLPATLTYRVLAENPEEASQLIKTISPNSISYKLIGRKDLNIKVYDAGCSIIRFIKK